MTTLPSSAPARMSQLKLILKFLPTSFLIVIVAIACMTLSGTPYNTNRHVPAMFYITPSPAPSPETSFDAPRSVSVKTPPTPQPGECTGNDLGITAYRSQDAMHNFAVILRFVNIGPLPCNIQGYPGVALVDEMTNLQKYQASWKLSGFMGGVGSDSTPPSVHLQPYESASAIVEGPTITDGLMDFCTHSATLLVTPPDTTSTRPEAISVPDCFQPAVHPVVLGITGDQS